MNRDKNAQFEDSNANNDALRDCSGDEGSAIEDDAPESFRVPLRSEPPLETFPDLLRVPTSTTNNSVTEDDTPESLVSAPVQPFRPTVSISKSVYRPFTSNLLNPSLSNNVQTSEGASNFNRAFIGPDISQVEPANSTIQISRIPQTSSSSRGSSTPAPLMFHPRPLPPLPVGSNLDDSSLPPRHQPGSSITNEVTNRIANHPHRSPINCLNLSSALYSTLDSNPSSSSSSLSSALAPINDAIARVQSSIDALSRDVNERFAALENRLDSLTSLSNLGASFNINSSDYTNGSGEIGSDSLKKIIKEQRQELQNERQEFLLSFANALKFAAESSTQGEASVSKTNGTGH
ncbi:probable serine/threonine-protein kinase nek3 [Tetranychus urticae]|nr:probable serine/threonine-protein kinase nek3 [Tetranychus urticae]XP_015785172.1 probable serine/threonine-protein kinase nek3 [Tetranychus urticae]